MADAYEVIDQDYYTYADYKLWPEHPRYELYNGKAYMMSSPSVEHQSVVGEFHRQFSNFLLGKKCKVFVAPLDVRLFFREDETDDTVVQPDLLVVCDKNILSKNSINGAPDLVIEVISPSTTAEELLRKFNYYLDSGVKEYWLVNLAAKTIQINILRDGHYVSASSSGAASIDVTVLPGLTIDTTQLWG